MLNKKKEKNVYAKTLLGDECSWEVKEAYKTLRTNVTFSINGKDTKVIAVTSAMPGDGKTLNAINHAISFAQIEKKTIIIDADMRLPTVAGKLKIEQEYGLSNYLAGQKQLADIIFRCKEYGLDVIPSGTIPPDPTRLLQSTRMRAMIERLRDAYDYIIIDLPPVTTVSDASIIAKDVDGYLLVVRNGQTDIRAVADMMERLSMAEAKVIGFVNNDVVKSANNYYYSKKYYGRYGYYRKSGEYRK